MTLQSIGDGVLATDAEGKVVLMNPAAERLTGWSTQEATGELVEAVLPLRDEATGESCQNPIAAVIATREPREFPGPFELVTRHGERRLIADSCAPIRPDGTDVIGVVMVFRDVTVQERADRERRHRERLQGVIETAGAAAHELSQPLQVLSGYVQLLQIKRDRISLDATLALMLRQIDRMAQISCGLTNVTRYETKEYVGEQRILDLAMAAGAAPE